MIMSIDNSLLLVFQTIANLLDKSRAEKHNIVTNDISFL